MRKHITIGIRVTARRGEFLPKEPGKERQTRAKWYGIVSESVGDNLWVITWDNGQSTREKSTALCIEPSTAGRQPLLPLSPQGQAPRRGSGNDIYEHPDHLAGAAGAVLIIDDHGNLCTRNVPRPALISRYFKDSPKVDNHNQARQHDLGLEELWGTQDCWFRLHVTLQGITATDCWKLTRYHVASTNKFKTLTINDFSDVLAARLIYNNLLNGSRTTTRTANKRPLQVSVATDLICNHKPVSLPRVKGKTKQVRCRWCAVFNDTHTSYTSVVCSECKVGLCVKTNRSSTRDCFDLHRSASALQLQKLTSTAKSRGNYNI